MKNFKHRFWGELFSSSSSSSSTSSSIFVFGSLDYMNLEVKRSFALNPSLMTLVVILVKSLKMMTTRSIHIFPLLLINLILVIFSVETASRALMLRPVDIWEFTRLGDDCKLEFVVDSSIALVFLYSLMLEINWGASPIRFLKIHKLSKLGIQIVNNWSFILV